MTTIEVFTESSENWFTKDRLPRAKPIRVKYTTLIDGKPHPDLCFTRKYEVVHVDKKTKQKVLYPIKGAVDNQVDILKWAASGFVENQRNSAEKSELNKHVTVEV